MLTLEQALKCLPEQAIILQRFHSESANKVALVEMGGKQFVLRLRASSATVSAETKIQSAAAAIMRAPVVSWLDADNGVWLSDYWATLDMVAGRLTSADIASLGQCLSDVHSLTCAAPAVNLPVIAESYAAHALPEDRELATKALGQLLNALECVRSRPRVLSHMDPTRDNWVSAKDPGLIDWEYAGYCDPLFDLVATAETFQLKPAEITLLLESYNLGHGRELTADWSQWLEIYRALTALWRFNKRATSRS